MTRDMNLNESCHASANNVTSPKFGDELLHLAATPGVF